MQYNIDRTQKSVTIEKLQDDVEKLQDDVRRLEIQVAALAKVDIGKIISDAHPKSAIGNSMQSQ